VTDITLLYTAHLEGDLRLLPRLSTLIQQERRAAAGPVFLFDLGDTCALEAWICPATQGRAPFMVLDGLGYDAVIVGGPEQVPIPPASLYRLLETIVVPVVIWNTTLELRKRETTFYLAAGSAALPAGAPGVRVDRATQTLPAPGSSTITLGDVPHGFLARVDIRWPDWIVQESRWIALQDTTAPDPVTGALVDFVEEEARRFLRQQGGMS
jgi:2',3'-cyclic-nucleotide 2'-phosphodiesterase (5'-nucleotidase family)